MQRSSTKHDEPLQEQEAAAPSEPVQVLIKQDNENAKDLKEADQLIVSIREELEEARQDNAESSWRKISIYRIPRYLKKDDKAYVPQTVSIGPYHHGKKRLHQMERHKRRSLVHVLTRTGNDVKVYLDAMKEMEERARSCYEGSVVLATNDFVKMLVLDGCFVLELFQGAFHGFDKLGYDSNDPVFSMRGSMHSIQRDMIMLENQLPLFVLDRLLGIQHCNRGQKVRVAQLALRFFDHLMSTNEPSTESDNNKGKSSGDSDPPSDLNGLHCLDVFRRSLLQPGQNKSDANRSNHHCLDVFRRSLHPTDLNASGANSSNRATSNVNQSADKGRMQLIHCVTELKGAGIKFKKPNTGRFLDIKFRNGVLLIPHLLIHDGTKSLFLNLIAYEQCHLNLSNDITSYIIFMDNLINSPDDVAYLHSCRIIEHWLGNNAEVAELFNRICHDVGFDKDNSYLSHLTEDVNIYYNKRWNTWRATLKYRYFNNPWTFFSLAAAVALLLLTVAQTFYAVYGYHNPP